MASKPKATVKDSPTVSNGKRSATESVMPQSKPPPRELMAREFKRRSLYINPDYVRKLEAANIIGYARPITQILPTMRYYTINVDTFRETISRLIKPYIRRKLYELDIMSFDEADNVVATVVPAITNACMAALYSKLHSVHTKFQTYADRYATIPSYTKEMKLPLPLADAIDNFGPFTPTNNLIHYICIPTYPANVANEGRSSEHGSSYLDISYLSYLKQLGIPVKSVDTRPDVGSPWWTYKVTYFDRLYDFQCIYAASNYSDHSTMCAALFARVNEKGEALSIIQHLAGDKDYPFRLSELPDGYQLKAFAALCHAPSIE